MNFRACAAIALTATFFSSLAGCRDKAEQTAATEQAAKPPGKRPPMLQRSQEMMGTIIQINVPGEATPEREQAIKKAFAEMHRLEAVLSEWRPDSEISQINAGAGRRSIKVSEDTMKVVTAGMEVARWSDGAFDISWAALRGVYNFKPGDERVPTAEELSTRLPLINFRDIIINRKAMTIKLAKRGMAIGTGGIAKGYALDHAGDILKAAGIDSFMIFGGGQIQLHGRKQDRGWRVGIQHPRKQDYFAFVESEGGSISTSGDYERFFIKDGLRHHHLLNPRTGQPVRHSTSVTVIAQQGLYADALSTAVFVMGPERSLAIADSVPGAAEFVALDADMRVHMTPNMQQLLVFKQPLAEGRVP